MIDRGQKVYKKKSDSFIVIFGSIPVIFYKSNYLDSISHNEVISLKKKKKDFNFKL